MTFGISEIKREGCRIEYDKGDNKLPVQKTWWFERAFSKNEFAQLAQALKDSDHYWLRELSADFAARSVNGYGQ